MSGDLVAHSLEQVAERCPDPAPLVYARLFAAHPEMEAQFALDRTGAVRGEMLAIALQVLLDLEDEGYAARMIRAELVNHDAWGVPVAVFGTFFETVAAAFRDLLGPDWTAEVDAAWRGRLARIDQLVADQARRSGLPFATG